MATKASAPKFEMPTIEGFGVRPDAFVAMHKANIETLMQIQGIMADAVQSIAKLQYGWFEENTKHLQGAFTSEKVERRPDALFADAKTVAERTLAVGKEQAEIGVKAQQEVAELVVKRVQKNFEEARTIAA